MKDFSNHNNNNNNTISYLFQFNNIHPKGRKFIEDFNKFTKSKNRGNEPNNINNNNSNYNISTNNNFSF